MSILSREFVDSYKGKVAPWGFGGLGEIVYLRTYSRRIQEEGRNETWVETLERVVNGAVEIGVNYTEEEAQILFDVQAADNGAAGFGQKEGHLPIVRTQHTLEFGRCAEWKWQDEIKVDNAIGCDRIGCGNVALQHNAVVARISFDEQAAFPVGQKSTRL